MSRIDIAGMLDPQMAAALAKQAELWPAAASIRELPVAEARALYKCERAYWNEDAPAVARVETGAVPGPAGAIPLRTYYPEAHGALPALVYLHGGGWILGDLDTHDKIMRLLALRAGVAVVGVDYRLAPEHKFPTQLEEALAVVRHLMRHGGELGLDPARLAIGGDSAGANMSAAVCLDLQAARPAALKAAVLFYGAYGLRDSPSRRQFGGPEDGLGPEDLSYYEDCLARSADDLRGPRFDVLSADLSGLPPLFIAAAEIDPLVDDSRALAALAAAAGVERVLEVYSGVLHGFLHLGRMVDKAGAAIDDAARWLGRVLETDSRVTPQRCDP